MRGRERERREKRKKHLIKLQNLILLKYLGNTTLLNPSTSTTTKEPSIVQLNVSMLSQVMLRI